jgi:hypothetical protein
MAERAVFLRASNDFDRTRLRTLDSAEEALNKGLQVREPVCFRVKDDDSDRQRIEVLLKGEIAIDRNEHIEML